MDLVGRRGSAEYRLGSNKCRLGRVRIGMLDQITYFCWRAFAHFSGVGPIRNAGCQEKISPRAGVANSLRDTRKPNLQRGARRAGENYTQIKHAVALRGFQCRSNLPRTFAGLESQDIVDGRMLKPQIAQFFRSQHRQGCLGESLAQAQQRGRGHYGVAEPVDASHENSMRGGCQRKQIFLTQS